MNGPFTEINLLLFFIQSEPEGFTVFHLYVCAAFLMKFADDAKKERDFQVGDYVTYFILLVLQLGDCLKVYVP